MGGKWEQERIKKGVVGGEGDESESALWLAAKL